RAALMTKTRVVFFTILLAAIGLGSLLLWIRQPAPQQVGPQSSPESVTTPPIEPDAVEVLIANASTKQRWFAELAKDFQAEGRKTSKGHAIVITAKPVLSGGSMDDILNGKLKPVAWSPGVSSWVQDFDETWKQRTGGTLMSQACRPTVYAPLG